MCINLLEQLLASLQNTLLSQSAGVVWELAEPRDHSQLLFFLQPLCAGGREKVILWVEVANPCQLLRAVLAVFSPPLGMEPLHLVKDEPAENWSQIQFRFRIYFATTDFSGGQISKEEQVPSLQSGLMCLPLAVNTLIICGVIKLRWLT